MRGKNTSFDSLVSTYDIDDYSFTKLKERFKIWTGRSFEEKGYVSMGMVADNGKLTNAGALLADESPIRWSRVFCTHWNGKTKSGGIVDAFDHAEYSGSLISLLNDAESFIMNNTKTIWKKLSNSRLELPEYVHRSYFDALVNALIHRDYLINGSEVHVDIFDDRMEIYSPGGMPDGTVIQDRNIQAIPSMRRNPVIADIFARLGYMERSGSGLGKIRSSYEVSANFETGKEPVFYSDRSQFLVTLCNLNYRDGDMVKDSSENASSASEINLRQDQILQTMLSAHKYSLGEVADKVGLKETMAKILLDDLVEKGYLRFVAGVNRGRYLRVR